jgi:hypothetical protein
MEYRGVEYQVVQTIPKGWRWSVRRDRTEKVGSASDRMEAVGKAHRFIDEMIKSRQGRRD